MVRPRVVCSVLYSVRRVVAGRPRAVWRAGRAQRRRRLRPTRQAEIISRRCARVAIVRPGQCPCSGRRRGRNLGDGIAEHVCASALGGASHRHARPVGAGGGASVLVGSVIPGRPCPSLGRGASFHGACLCRAVGLVVGRGRRSHVIRGVWVRQDNRIGAQDRVLIVRARVRVHRNYRVQNRGRVYTSKRSSPAPSVHGGREYGRRGRTVSPAYLS